MNKTITGQGCAAIGASLYELDVRAEAARQRRAGKSPTFASVMAALPNHNQDMLWDACWSTARAGAF